MAYSDNYLRLQCWLLALGATQAKVDPEGKPGFFAIASPPDVNNQGVLELLVKRQPGTAADAICDLAEGSELKVSPVMVRKRNNLVSCRKDGHQVALPACVTFVSVLC